MRTEAYRTNEENILEDGEDKCGDNFANHTHHEDSNNNCNVPINLGHEVDNLDSVEGYIDKEIYNNIYILGGQLCSGLAAGLLHSRDKSKYGKYKISAVIKPSAQSEDILKSARSLNVTMEDIIFINIGDYD